jgi:RNA-binding protein
MPLSVDQKKYLRGLLHALKPVVIIGQNGLTENVNAEIDAALTYHELIKIKINAERDERETIVAAICEQHKAERVQYIGKMLSLFKRNKQKPRITLP